MKARALLPLLLAGIAVLVFCRSLGNGFVHDDHQLVERNVLVRTLDPTDHLSATFWSRWRSQFEYYRPATTFSLAVDRAVFGESPKGFHFTNLLLHAANALLLFFLIRRLGGATAAGIAAGLFAVHPVQTESVAWIVGRTDLLATGFALAATLVYARLPDRIGATSIPSLALLAVLLGGGLLSKEAAVTTPFLFFGVEIARARSAGIRWTEAARAASRRLAWCGLVVAVLVGAYLIARYRVVGMLVGGSENAGESWALPLLGVPWIDRVMTAIHIAGRYLRLLALPTWLSVDYGPDVVPVIRSPLTAAFLVPLAGVAGAVAVAIGLARRSPVASFGAVAFAAPYVLVSHLLFTGPVVMAERLLYLPMVGVAAMGAAGLIAACRLVPAAASRERLAAIVAVVLLLPMAARSFARTGDWKDDRSIFEAATRAEPRSLLSWTNLGADHARRGELDRATECFDRALAVRADWIPALWRKADVLRRRGELETAARLLRHATEIRPEFRLAWVNLAQVLNARAEEFSRGGDRERALAISRDVVAIAKRRSGENAMDADTVGERVVLLREEADALARLGEDAGADVAYERAIEALREAERDREATPESLAGVEAALLASSASHRARTGRRDEAAERFETAAEAARRAGQPGLEKRLRLAAADEYTGVRRTDAAIRLYDAVLSGNAEDADARRGRAHARLVAGDLDGAESDLSVLLEARPGGRALADLRTEMARVSILRGDAAEGRRRLDDALRADPGFEEARRLRERLGP